MWEDYKKLVREFYQMKREGNKLASALRRPSPAELRDECFKVCASRYRPKDLRTLQDFFGEVKGKEDCLREINQSSIDKFKPLQKYLNNVTEDPKERIIELLAWLIDFPGRPWDIGKKYPDNLEEYLKGLSTVGAGMEAISSDNSELAACGTQPTPIEDNHPLPVASSTGSGTPIRSMLLPAKWIIPAALLLVSALGFSIYKFGSNDQPAVQLIGKSGPCMLWDEVQYKIIQCDQSPPGSIIIPVDSLRLNDFKRVTRTDTITLKSERKLWYLKRKNKVEVFTAPGSHPEEPHRQLRPLTAYMIKKYFLSGNKK